ncbi:DJ-1/PfpI family protein [Kribbella sp. HUAS MG21]|uniref:DJ-1/PfpI family protein n=1 Tax=Kribbella sp. HUAS MG21 TaxID=3160966 RepID=A0AAU7TEC9_9ACTN
MQIAILVYPGFTSLDIIGPYEILGRLPGTEVVLVGGAKGLMTNDLGALSIDVPATFEDVPAPDVVLVGGGPGQVHQMADGRLHEWLRAADATSAWTTSVCTGSLILAGAGLLKGRRATSHWLALEQLPQYGVTPAHERVVIDGHYATAAGVSSGIDMALKLAGELTDDDVARTIQLIVEYAPEPPYAAGSLDTASPTVVNLAKARLSGRFADS